MNLTKAQITKIAGGISSEYAMFKSFIETESNGDGFNTDGKIIIQFEPHWFSHYLVKDEIAHTLNIKYNSLGKKYFSLKVDSVYIENGVEGQTAEWKAFNKAFAIHPEAAMLSTSIGLMQVMGFNFASMGYKSVGAMWDDFKKGEYQQVAGAARFIQSNKLLHQALLKRDFKKIAYYYNGSNYAVNKYDIKLKNNYLKALNG